MNVIPSYRLAEIFTEHGQPMTKNEMHKIGLSKGRFASALLSGEIVADGRKGTYKTYRLSDRSIKMLSHRENLKTRIQTGEPGTLKRVRAIGLTPLFDPNTKIYSLAPYRHLPSEGIVTFDLNRPPKTLKCLSGTSLTPLSLYYEGLARLGSSYGKTGIPAIVDSIPNLRGQRSEFIAFKEFTRKCAITGINTDFISTHVGPIIDSYPKTKASKITLIAYKGATKALLPLGMLVSTATVANAAEPTRALAKETWSWAGALGAGALAAPSCYALGHPAAITACTVFAAITGGLTGEAAHTTMEHASQLLAKNAGQITDLPSGPETYTRSASEFISSGSVPTYYDYNKGYMNLFTGYNVVDPPTPVDRFFSQAGSDINDGVHYGGGWCSDPGSPGCSTSARSCTVGR